MTTTMIGCQSRLTATGPEPGKPIDAWPASQSPESDEWQSSLEPMSVVPVAAAVSDGWRQRRAPLDSTEPTPDSMAMLQRKGSHASIMDACDTVTASTTRHILMATLLLICLLSWGFLIICMYASEMKHHLGATMFGQGLGRLLSSVVFSLLHLNGHSLFEPMGDISCGEVFRECLAPFVCGILLGVACLCLALGVRAGIPASVLGPGASLYVVFAVVLGICHKRERLTLKRLIGLSGAVAAAMLLATEAKKMDAFFTQFSFEAQHLLYLGGVCVAWGSSCHGMTTASSGRSLKLVLIMHDLGSFFFGTMALLVSPTHNQLVKQKGVGVFLWQFGFVVLSSSLSTIGSVCYVLLSRMGKETSLIVPLTSMWSIVVSIWGWTVRGEAINAPQLVGVVLSPVCIAMLMTSEKQEGDAKP